MTNQTRAQTPALPALYFSSDESILRKQPAESKEDSTSLLVLPPEVLNCCLVKYADWGDLAKLACVQSKWKNIVADAAEFSGRDACWELTMCLLGHGGHDDRKSVTENDECQNAEEVSKRNSRGLQKNEALAIKYLTRLSGVEVKINSLLQSSEESNSLLPNNPINLKSSHNTGTYVDEAALLQLATCYLSGTGLPAPDPTQALNLLQLAYHLTDSAQAAYQLALLYEYPVQSSNLIAIDIVAAFEWFQAAANLGCGSGMAELALCYELGCGVSQSDEMALELYVRAANAGHSAAYHSVGEHYEQARGVPLDHEEACLWYWRSACCGEEEGVDGLKRLEDVARRVIPEATEVVFNA